MSLQGNLLGSPDGDVPLVGGLGVAVLAGRAGEGLRGEGGEEDLGLVGLFSLFGFEGCFALGVVALLAPPPPPLGPGLFGLPGDASPVLEG